jgi:hypothetical protein
MRGRKRLEKREEPQALAWRIGIRSFMAEANKRAGWSAPGNG